MPHILGTAIFSDVSGNRWVLTNSPFQTSLSLNGTINIIHECLSNALPPTIHHKAISRIALTNSPSSNMVFNRFLMVSLYFSSSIKLPRASSLNSSFRHSYTFWFTSTIPCNRTSTQCLYKDTSTKYWPPSTSCGI